MTNDTQALLALCNSFIAKMTETIGHRPVYPPLEKMRDFCEDVKHLLSSACRPTEGEVAEIRKRHAEDSYADGGIRLSNSVACHRAHADRATLLRLFEPLTAGAITEEQIKHMVDRFLGWKLPRNFSPDGGISFDPIANPGWEFESRREPTGTNLLDATQADAMVRYMIYGLQPSPPRTDTGVSREQIAQIIEQQMHHIEWMIGKRPSIDELERMLNSPEPPRVTLLPDGSITAGEPREEAFKAADAILALLNEQVKS